jgi:cysteine synthase B
MGTGPLPARAPPGVRIVAPSRATASSVYGLRNIDEGFVPELYDGSC